MTRLRARAAATAAAALLGALAACSAPVPEQRVAPPSPSAPPAERPGDQIRFAAVGDLGDGSANQARVATAIARHHVGERLDFLLLLGDVIYPDGHPRRYRSNYERPYRPVTRLGIETLVTLGNHDIQTNTESFMELFGMPGRFYELRRGPVHLFSVDSSKGSVDDEQLAWLQGELSESTAPWKVVFTHVAPFSSGWHGDNETLIEQLAPVFAENNVQLVLAGHDHNYERLGEIDGVTYIVSGGGCCPRPIEPGDRTVHASSVLHFVVVDAGPDSLTLRAIDVNGRVIDSTTLSRVPVPA